MTCREMMTPNPACCVPDDNVVTAAMLMQSQNAGSIPVLEDRTSRKLIGILTDRDLTLRVIGEQRDYYSTHVKQIMSRDVVSCHDTDDYQKVLKAMAKYQVRRVPVLDQHDGLVGIISQADVARFVDKPAKVADVVESISEPVGDRKSGKGRAGWLLASGLSLGAGLFLLAGRARQGESEFDSQYDR